MSTSVRVKGLAELQAALDQLPARMEANVMRGALRAGARVLQAEAKRLVPVSLPNEENQRLYGAYMGLLRDSIRVRVSLRNGRVTARVEAGGSGRRGKGAAYYARWVELGTKPHPITAAARKSLQISGAFPAVVMHPGAQPRPYLRPALDGKAQDALRAAAEYIRGRLATKHGITVPAPLEPGDS